MEKIKDKLYLELFKLHNNKGDYKIELWITPSGERKIVDIDRQIYLKYAELFSEAKAYSNDTEALYYYKKEMDEETHFNNYRRAEFERDFGKYYKNK